MKLPKMAVVMGAEAQLREIIGTAVGHGSMCWNPPPSTQVFDSTEASAAVDDAVNKIRALAEFELVEPDRNMTFGQAITALKGGRSVCREGWNGKGMYLTLQQGHPVNGHLHPSAHNTPLPAITEDGTPNLPQGSGGQMLSHIVLKTAGDSVSWGAGYYDYVPWTASQTDILAEDWMIHV